MVTSVPRVTTFVLTLAAGGFFLPPRIWRSKMISMVSGRPQVEVVGDQRLERSRGP